MKQTLSVLSLVLLASVVEAQTSALPTDYTLTHHLVSNPNGASVTAPYSFPITSPALQCGQPRVAVPNTVVINPRFYRWNDPVNEALDCVFDKTLATTPLFTDPPIGGDYVARIVAVARVGSVTLTSPMSDPSNPFVRGTIPPVVLNLRTIGQ